MHRLILAAAPGWLPPRASEGAGKVDSIFMLILGITTAFFVIIVVAATYFTIRYRARKWTAPQPSPSHHLKLELVWSIIPTILLVAIFGVSTKAWLASADAGTTEAATTVYVTGQQWKWQFEYQGGKRSDELHLLLNEPVDLVLSSPDVLHSFYVPAFRIKQDVVPGRFTRMHVTPTEAGNFPIFCAEYCGNDHSIMQTQVVIHADQASYDAWKNEKIDESIPLVKVGELLFQKNCQSCHSLDGTRKVGPTFKGLWGSTQTMEGGEAVTVDENFVRESIVEPKKRIVQGYPPAMPPQSLGEREMQGIIEYIRSVK
ncbi:MAG: cytochrome c oxidase subunit II [Polyangiaceae bacterium]|nr:cytochrome c oxidase subunit II [Polyangiaceae bacterium]